MDILNVTTGSAYGLDSTSSSARLATNLARREDEASSGLLMADGVTAAKAGQKPPDGCYKLDRKIGSVPRHSGRILCCGTCMDARGITDDMLVTDAGRSTMDAPGDHTLAADKVLVF